MSGSERDEFSKSTIDVMAKRVAYRCSNPSCRKVTSGPNANKHKYTNIGVAAHIKAAAPGGKRYDPFMTSEERCDIDNGIWLCQSCSKLIDSDETTYTVELLHRWKDRAEEEIGKLIATNSKERMHTDLLNRDDGSLWTADDTAHIEEILNDLMDKIPRLARDFRALELQISNQLYLEALENWEDLGYIDERLEEIHIWLYYMINEYENAMARITKSGLSSAFLLSVKGRCLVGTNQFKEAVSVYQKLNNLQPAFTSHIMLARCYQWSGNSDLAEKTFYECLEYQRLENLIYFEIGRMKPYSKQCISLMNKAIQYDNQFAEAYLYKGIALRYLGKYEQAIRSLEQYQELSGDHKNEQVLLELAMAFYNNRESDNLYLNRWLECFLENHPELNLDDGEALPVIDIGYDYTNIMFLVRRGESIEISVNGQDLVKIQFTTKAKSGIGLYLPPANLTMLSFFSDNEEEVIRKGSIPALYRIYDTMEEYRKTKEILISEKVLHLNHKFDAYEEYHVSSENVRIRIVKKLNSLNASIRIGSYVMDEWLPETKEGFHAFRSKIQEGPQCDEAAVILIGPEEHCQITFHVNRIELTDKS